MCIQRPYIPRLCVCLLVIGMIYCANIQVCVPCSLFKKKYSYQSKGSKNLILVTYLKNHFFFLWSIYLTSVTLYWENFTSCIGSSDGKESACNIGDPGSIPGLERSPGERNGYTLQYSCLENPMDRGTWWATVHGVAKSWTQLSG